MIFLTYIQNLTTIGVIVYEIVCLIQIWTEGRHLREAETRDLFFHTLGVMKRRENMKKASPRWTRSIYIHLINFSTDVTNSLESMS